MNDDRLECPAPGKYWMRNTDIFGVTQWRIVWVRIAVTSNERECVELGRTDPWSAWDIRNTLQPEEWVPILPPTNQPTPTSHE